MFWVWLQLLQFNISNQTVSPEEDKNNKPDRPLPSKRLSFRTALILRWLMPFVCLAWSYSYSKEVALACLAGCILTWVYNEAGFAAGHWAGRNVVNGLGLGSFETGASLIAGSSKSRNRFRSVTNIVSQAKASARWTESISCQSSAA